MTVAPALALIILDGWGLAPAGPGNAISQAETPVFDRLLARYPHTTLTASGEAVGLPAGQMGNSEVGHLNLGAGMIVRQDLTRIDRAIADGSFMENPVLKEAMSTRSRLHLVGLVSDGGVHSGDRHLKALIEMAAACGVSDLVIHGFTDGRDTSPTAGAAFIEQIDKWCAEAGVGRVGSLIGRYFAMDRDNRWDRIQRAYDLLLHGKAVTHADNGAVAVRAAYAAGQTDEFLEPITIGEPALIRPEDTVIAFNFRPDRMRQLTCALAQETFTEVDRGAAAALKRYYTLTEYEEGWPYPVAFTPERPKTTIAQVIAETGGKQLHVAETEKYPHVTYFFNGGNETPYKGERRQLVASPRDVPTYDYKPQMSAEAATKAFVDAWAEDQPRFAIINFANPDMVGHTGVIPAAVQAVETVDRCLGEVIACVLASGGTCMVTADHGNAEHMLEADGSPNTAHSLNPVPFIVTDESVTLCQDGGILADVAPTALALLGIRQPTGMTGRSLLVAAA